MRTALIVCIALFTSDLVSAQHATLLPPDLEVELAASALPAHMRSEATVYRLTEKGYVVAREGTNGFACLTRQQGVSPAPFHQSFMSVCYDAEGSATLLQADLLQARLFAEGKNHEEVAQAIDEAWKSGRFLRPGPGIAYMLSPVQHIKPLGRDARSYIPHLMFYAPDRDNAVLRGAAPPDPFGYEPYMASPGQPWAMMIVPMAPEIRTRLAEEHEVLIEQMKAYIADS